MVNLSSCEFPNILGWAVLMVTIIPRSKKNVCNLKDVLASLILSYNYLALLSKLFREGVKDLPVNISPGRIGHTLACSPCLRLQSPRRQTKPLDSMSWSCPSSPALAISLVPNGTDRRPIWSLVCASFRFAFVCPLCGHQVVPRLRCEGFKVSIASGGEQIQCHIQELRQ